jgi:DNA-binding response OmpR family regulator
VDVEPASGQTAPEPPVEGGHILVVDDSLVNRNVLLHRLERQGHTVSLAENGFQALEAMRTQPPDLVLLDIMMPEMDGYQVLEQRKIDPQLCRIPVIVISALDDIDSVVKCIELGAEDYLPKPFNPVLLRARVNAILDRKRLQDQERQYVRRIEEEKDRSEKLLHVVIPIGIALPAEKDFNRLLEMILLEGKSLCNADAGTLYLRTEADQLKFVIMRNDSLNVALGGTTGKAISFQPLPLYNANGEPNRHNVATHTALTGESSNIPDAYEADGFDFSGVKAFDQKTGYRSQSFLTIPLKNNVNRVIGVLQLINARNKAGEIVPFDPYLQQMIESLSALATVALEAYIREQELRQQIEQLRIEIDETKKARQVAEITETEYFQQLQKKARQIRRKMEGES